MIQFNGFFDGHAITPDGAVDIPINVPLRLTAEPTQKEQSTTVDWQRILDLAKQYAIDGPTDLAERHDYYAHGKEL